MMLSITNISARISRSLLLCSSRCNDNILKLTNIRCNNSSSQTSFCITKRWKGDTAKRTKSNKVGVNGGSESPPPHTTFLQRFLAPKPMPPKYTTKWYGEMVLICTVFGITGSSTMFLVRPAVSKVLGLEGSMKDGPWSYRIASLVLMTPIYSALLVIVGTVFGRHAYFRHFSVKMFSRFGIPPELMDKNFHKTAKNFRKW